MPLFASLLRCCACPHLCAARSVAQTAVLFAEADSARLSCSSDDELGRVSMPEGRSNGRLARRQKRLERIRAKEVIAREERQARKQLAKVSHK